MFKRELDYLKNKRRNDDENFAQSHQNMKNELVSFQERANGQFLTVNDFKIDHI